MTRPAYTTSQAAAALGLKPRRVQQLLTERGLGQKFGRDYVILAGELEQLKIRRPPGRPKGGQ